MKAPILQRTIVVAAIICLVHLLFTDANGQYRERRYRKSNVYFGIEGTMGTKTFSVRSDISAIDGMKAQEEGFSLGAVLGGRTFLAKLRTGFFKPSSELGEKITARNLELNLNAFPLELFGTKNQFFKPYIIAGIDRARLKFLGNYSLPTPPQPPLPTQPSIPCPCVCPGDEEVVPVPESPPSVSTREEVADNSVLASVNIVWGSVGTGLIIHVPGKNKFINFFMEAQYGIPLSTRASSPAFDRTSTSEQLSLSAGIAMGLAR